MTGLTDEGLTIKRLSDIKLELDEGLKLVFGQELSIDPSTPESQMNGLVAEQISLLYEIAQSVYVGLNPNFATGAMLDLVSQIRGVIRKIATPSTVELTFEGIDGSVVPKGALFSSSGLPDVLFILNEEIALPSTGHATADVVGALFVPIGSVTNIVTPISGVDTVINETVGVTGANLETDADLRTRSNNATALPSVAIIESIQSGLANIAEVSQVIVFENDTDAFNAVTGTSPKSMRAIVLDGSDEDIAEVIFNRKSLGCGMDGSISVDVLDLNNLPHAIRFDRPVVIPVHIYVQVTELGDWDLNLIDGIKEKVVAFAVGGRDDCLFSGFNIGADVFASQLYPSLPTTSAYSLNQLLVDISTPAGEIRVSINVDQIASFDVIDVEVVSVI